MGAPRPGGSELKWLKSFQGSSGDQEERWPGSRPLPWAILSEQQGPGFWGT